MKKVVEALQQTKVRRAKTLNYKKTHGIDKHTAKQITKIDWLEKIINKTLHPNIEDELCVTINSIGVSYTYMGSDNSTKYKVKLKNIHDKRDVLQFFISENGVLYVPDISDVIEDCYMNDVFLDYVKALKVAAKEMRKEVIKKHPERESMINASQAEMQELEQFVIFMNKYNICDEESAQFAFKNKQIHPLLKTINNGRFVDPYKIINICSKGKDSCCEITIEDITNHRSLKLTISDNVILFDYESDQFDKLVEELQKTARKLLPKTPISKNISTKPEKLGL